MNNLIVELLKKQIEDYSHEAKIKHEYYQYYSGSSKLRGELIYILKRRSEYKRALKDYKKMCNEIKNIKRIEK